MMAPYINRTVGGQVEQREPEQDSHNGSDACGGPGVGFCRPRTGADHPPRLRTPATEPALPQRGHGRCADTNDPIDTSTCQIEQRGGPPAGLICDIPVTLFVVGGPEFRGFLCRTEDDVEEEPQSQPQPLPPAPITQEGEQDSESGDIDQSFEVTGGGDNSNQCPALQGVAQTGNAQDELGLTQYASTADEFEFEEVGSTIESSPVSTTTCDQQANQAASAFR
jgi:hypothetical protein